jgi:hypothetical protein
LLISLSHLLVEISVQEGNLVVTTLPISRAECCRRAYDQARIEINVENLIHMKYEIDLCLFESFMYTWKMTDGRAFIDVQKNSRLVTLPLQNRKGGKGSCSLRGDSLLVTPTTAWEGFPQ